MFTDKERAFIESQELLRISTVAQDGQPDVSPVIFIFEGDCFFIGGKVNSRTKKVQNVANGGTKVALVLDDVISHDPWHGRGVKVFGIAELVQRPQDYAKEPWIKVTPTIHWSWGIEADPFIDGYFYTKKVVW